MRKVFLILGAAISVAAWAQSDARSEILVLGTYHMANPGHDRFDRWSLSAIAISRKSLKFATIR